MLEYPGWGTCIVSLLDRRTLIPSVVGSIFVTEIDVMIYCFATLSSRKWDIAIILASIGVLFCLFIWVTTTFIASSFLTLVDIV